MSDALKNISTRQTPQDEQADPRQVPNSAGGWGFTVSRDARLHRFLTLGTDGGTFYASERQLTQANAVLVLDWARKDPAWLAEQAALISEAGRAPRNNPALFAVAAACALGDDAGRTAAFAVLPRVARTGTHLCQFITYMTQFRGWGRAARRAVGGWYLDKPVDDLAYQVVKYRQREGWTHRDILRSAHPSAETADRRALFDWICGRAPGGEIPVLVTAFGQAQAATSKQEWVRLIEANRSLSWEMLPGAALNEPAVWEALIGNGMPQTALLRQLPRLTRIGLLTPMSAVTATVCDQLRDQQRLVKARVHPVNVLVAARTYSSGHSARGKGTWNPVQKVNDALDAAFYASYGSVEPAGKRTLVAVDVSMSMTSPVSGLPVSCREVAAAVAMVIAQTEPSSAVYMFTTTFRELPVTPRMRLDDVLRVTSGLSFGGTDCALPMEFARTGKLEIDTFVVITDNETWAGFTHPHQALVQYRNQSGIPARQAVLGLTATDITIADPADPGTLDLAGFDAAVPRLLADFSRGAI